MNSNNHPAALMLRDTTNTWQQLTAGTFIALMLLSVSACHKSATSVEAAKAESPAASATPEAEATAELTLTPEEIARIGITVSTAKTTSYSAEKEGYGVVIGHDVIAQAVSDVSTAEAAVQQSRAALARVQRLADTPGAFPAENAENAQRQAAADNAALLLAQRRLSSTLGQRPPWQASDHNSMLNELANGQVKLVRVTFPLGILNGTAPRTLRLAHLDPTSGANSWNATSVWDASADASVPGRSFFALLKDSDVSEGEHVQAWAAVGAAITGIEIPEAAVVISDSKYWCYVEKPVGTFTRVAVDTSKPVANGYIANEGFAVGDKLVITGAGLLLARQTNSASEAE